MGHFALPLPLPCSAEHVKPSGALLLDGGCHLILQIGKDAPKELLEGLLAVGHVDPQNALALADNGSDLAGRVRCMLKEMRLDAFPYASSDFRVWGKRTRGTTYAQSPHRRQNQTRDFVRRLFVRR